MYCGNAFSVSAMGQEFNVKNKQIIRCEESMNFVHCAQDDKENRYYPIRSNPSLKSKFKSHHTAINTLIALNTNILNDYLGHPWQILWNFWKRFDIIYWSECPECLFS